MGLPNLLTFFRIFLIPCFVLAFYLPIKNADILAATIFALASFTDWLDGFLARLLNQTTKFGAFLDPVADKLMVVVALVLIVGEYASIFITIPAAIIVCREIAISALREWMAEIGKRTSVSVNYIGKLKTFIQIISIILLIAQPPEFSSFWVIVGIVLMYAAVFLTLWSMMNYLAAAAAEFRSQ